jgi:hypothetical protein
MRTVLLALLFAVGASADMIGTFSMDTSGLVSSSSAPFTLDFQFNDGSGMGDANNTVTVSSFAFGGGSVTTMPSFQTGGVTVQSSPFGFTMTDSSFLNELQFSFVPGSSLSFHIDATTNPEMPSPDAFTFAILDKNGSEITTTNSNSSFLEIDLGTPSQAPSVTTSSSTDPSNVVPQPSFTPTSSTVPEPRSLKLALLALALFIPAATRKAILTPWRR